jgi:hypothetical protein
MSKIKRTYGRGCKLPSFFLSSLSKLMKKLRLDDLYGNVKLIADVRKLGLTTRH